MSRYLALLLILFSLSSCLLKSSDSSAPSNNETVENNEPPVDTVDHTDTVNTDPQFKPTSP